MVQLAIDTDNLTREFGSVRAVDGLSLQVPAGMLFGFLGPNGAGKTTTICLLLGLLQVTGGQARVLGFDVRTQADQIRQQTGALLEHPGLYERLSAEDNLEFYGRVWHLPAEDRRARIKELLSHFGLWDRRKEGVNTWSRGMKQKLAIARALLHRPALVFLDEPTAGLDPAASVAIRDDLAALATREGVTVFLTTHNLAEAEKLCERVGVIRQGKLVATGRPDELRAENATPRIVVVGRGFSDDVLAMLQARPEVAGLDLQGDRLFIDLRRDHLDVAPLVSALTASGAQIEEVRKERPSLEETFLMLVQESK